jgi:hypothetical protein
MRAAIVKTHTEVNTTAAALDTAVNAFLAGLTEQSLIDLQYQHVLDGGTEKFSVCIIYTE